MYAKYRQKQLDIRSKMRLANDGTTSDIEEDSSEKNDSSFLNGIREETECNDQLISSSSALEKRELSNSINNQCNASLLARENSNHSNGVIKVEEKEERKAEDAVSDIFKNTDLLTLDNVCHSLAESAIDAAILELKKTVYNSF